jgi:hypothetical protein
VPLELFLRFRLPASRLTDQRKMIQLAHQIPKRNARIAAEQILLAYANLVRKRDALAMRCSIAQISLRYALTLPVEEM